MLKRLDNGAAHQNECHRDKRADRLPERAHLYAAGYTDAEIAHQLHVRSSAIQCWRYRKGLPPNGLGAKRVAPEVEAARLAVYQEGLNDVDAGERLGTSADVIRKWRGVRDLPPNTPSSRNRYADKSLSIVTPDLKRRALTLLERGVAAKLISREMNVSNSTLDHWRAAILQARPELRLVQVKRPRKTPRHPGGKAYSKMLPHRRARAFLLYADGLDDGQIARQLSVKRQQVWEWRNALFLPPIIKPKRERERKVTRQPKRKPVGLAISPMSNPLYAHISKSIGRGIAPDLLDDAVSEIWLAIAEGRLTAEEVSSKPPDTETRLWQATLVGLALVRWTRRLAMGTAFA